ncbi:hypothetical protein C1280_27450 [Gemmata obscuriglobus]|uniref:Uncharacterized protein n=1 Tax=Gemmata obscuriglobus TaxID=114 RepID=A0A2Z3HA06_9BACT|nr:hypothetical protein C1280_27450 [Gemmata obscuriglobus]
MSPRPWLRCSGGPHGTARVAVSGTADARRRRGFRTAACARAQKRTADGSAPNPALHLTPPADSGRIAARDVAVQVSFMFGGGGRRSDGAAIPLISDGRARQRLRVVASGGRPFPAVGCGT